MVYAAPKHVGHDSKNLHQHRSSSASTIAASCAAMSASRRSSHHAFNSNSSSQESSMNNDFVIPITENSIKQSDLKVNEKNQFFSGSSHTISQLCGELDRSHGATLHLTADLASRAQAMAFSRPSWLGANQRTNSSRPVADLTSTKYLAWNLITEKRISEFKEKSSAYSHSQHMKFSRLCHSAASS